MTVKNKYANRSKISEKKICQIVKLFSIDLDAPMITKISGLNRNNVTGIAQVSEKELPCSVKANGRAGENLRFSRCHLASGA